MIRALLAVERESLMVAAFGAIVVAGTLVAWVAVVLYRREGRRKRPP